MCQTIIFLFDKKKFLNVFKKLRDKNKIWGLVFVGNMYRPGHRQTKLLGQVAVQKALYATLTPDWSCPSRMDLPEDVRFREHGN